MRGEGQQKSDTNIKKMLIPLSLTNLTPASPNKMCSLNKSRRCSALMPGLSRSPEQPGHVEEADLRFLDACVWFIHYQPLINLIFRDRNISDGNGFFAFSSTTG